MLSGKLIASTPRRLTSVSISILRGAKSKVVSGIHGAQTKIQTPQTTVVDNIFGKYLLFTNTVSSGLLMIAGDVICQEIEYRKGILKNRYDFKRIWQMFLVGSLQGPMHHYFYGWLAKRMPEATIRNAGKKILWDQIVMSPACILMFFYPACLLEKKPIVEATKEIQAKFLTVYITDWCVWPAAQFINFYYLPAKYNVMFVNICTMLYNIFLSHMKHKDFH